MFAIIDESGRQIRVSEGDTVQIDYQSDVEPGQSLTFERVLLANGGAASVVGRPVIDGASVEAEVVNPEVKGVKLEVQKFRRRKNFRKHTGHRQKFTTVMIKRITVPGLETAETESA